jgi:hypothetical protein
MDKAPPLALPFGEYLRRLSVQMSQIKANLDLPDPALKSRQSLTAQRLHDHRDVMRCRRFEVLGESTDSAVARQRN